MGCSRGERAKSQILVGSCMGRLAVLWECCSTSITCTAEKVFVKMRIANREGRQLWDDGNAVFQSIPPFHDEEALELCFSFCRGKTRTGTSGVV
jgi:hypothetical protein